ncbi:14947_t:CDS:10 [Dentiscutata erythropus]|uniref:14947_t:CDS:1 n=1 Tax=Dentiscutata erythropus TaxID=1348616 RepID=A0A9N9EFY7_9GLOM|nr:14947_t:CDS:10 [Dentiscutata erythropus]
MEKMKAVRFNQKGDIKNLVVEEIEKPTPKQGELLIKVHASAINPSDAFNVLGRFQITTLPRTPGRDFAGIVVDGPPEWLNKEVFGTGGYSGFTFDGTHAEYVIATPETVAIKPENLSLIDAASIGVGFLTAYLALDTANIKEGENVLVIGARGAVGSAAVQITKFLKARPIGTFTNNPLPEIGADFVDTSTEDLKKKVLDLTDQKGVDIVIDTVGHPAIFEKAFSSLKVRGRYVVMTVGRSDNKYISFDGLDFYRRELRLFGLNTLNYAREDAVKAFNILKPGFESDALRAPKNIKQYKLDQCIEAYEYVNTKPKEKIVFTPDTGETQLSPPQPTPISTPFSSILTLRHAAMISTWIDRLLKTNNEILGGYNPLIWKTDDDTWAPEADSFIFSLKNSSDFSHNTSYPIISRVKDKSKAILYRSMSKGPWFGSCDLGMGDVIDPKNWYCELLSYDRPIRMTGESWFSIVDYEVFQICKAI